MSDWTVCLSQYRERTGLLESRVILFKVQADSRSLFLKMLELSRVLPWKGWLGKETGFLEKEAGKETATPRESTTF